MSVQKRAFSSPRRESNPQGTPSQDAVSAIPPLGKVGRSPTENVTGDRYGTEIAVPFSRTTRRIGLRPYSGHFCRSRSCIAISSRSVTKGPGKMGAHPEDHAVVLHIQCEIQIKSVHQHQHVFCLPPCLKVNNTKSGARVKVAQRSQILRGVPIGGRHHCHGAGRSSENRFDYLRAVIVTKELCTTTPGGRVATQRSERGI